MRRVIPLLAVALITSSIPMISGQVRAAEPAEAVVALCEGLYGETFGTPNVEPLAACQWDMALIDAGSESYAAATGDGVTVGVIDTGVDLEHPDIEPNLDLDLSCSFIFDDTPTADPQEIANGDCSNNLAVDDFSGHGTHVASTIAAPVNGIGIAGVAPDATIVGLKACTVVGYCFADSVAAALRYAGDQRLDIVNLSLFADPYLYYCKNEAEQRDILREIEAAARYAQQRGVVIVASAGNESADLAHPGTDDISPDWPEGTAEVRDVGNNCVVAPAELPQTLTVSATGPVGIAGYDLWIADYSSVGIGVVEVTAPGGDYFRATGTVHDAILAALPPDSAIWTDFEELSEDLPGITVVDDGATYGYLNGTSMSSPHAAGVAALVREVHPGWSAKAVQSAVQRTATPLPCPPDWEPLGPGDERERCQGGSARNSFFGAGMVNALGAATS